MSDIENDEARLRMSVDYACNAAWVGPYEPPEARASLASRAQDRLDRLRLVEGEVATARAAGVVGPDMRDALAALGRMRESATVAVDAHCAEMLARGVDFTFVDAYRTRCRPAPT